MKRTMLLSALVASGGLAASALTLESDALAIHFAAAPSGFAVTSVVNKLCGDVRFVGTDMKSPDFWSISLASGGGKTVRLQNHTPSRERLAERLADGCAFIWKGLSIPGGEEACVDVRAEVRLPADAGGASEWTLSVVNRSKTWALKETSCPCLRGVVKSGEADVLMPFKGFGARLHRAYDTDKGAIGNIGYPGWYPMVCAYIKGGGGLYLAAHDPDGRNKTLAFGRGATVEFVTPVENAGVVGKAAEGPRYPVRLEAFKGDWWQAAHIYRSWALRQKWRAKGPVRKRSDFPSAIADVDVWMLGNGEIKSVTNSVARARTALPGLNLGLHWYGWNVQPFDTHYPEFLARPGVRDISKWMASIGVLTMPYINGRLWDQTLASAPYAWHDACAKPDGGICVERYNRREFAVMCPYSKGWQRTLLYTATNVVSECSAGALYDDQITCSRPQLCFNPAHGHPLGGGSWWVDGYRAAAARIHEALSAKGIPFTSEGTAESWLDVVDGHLIWTVPEADEVPFYTAVYSGYTIYYGTSVSAWDSLASFFAVQARTLVWGSTPGWSNLFTFNKGREKWAKALLTLGSVRHAGRDFLAYGTLEDELRLLEPQPAVPLETKRRKRGSLTEFDVSSIPMPAVFGTVWRDVTGQRTAIFAVNVSEEVRTVGFRLPRGIEAMKPLAGIPAAKASFDGGIATLTIAPRQVVALVSGE